MTIEATLTANPARSPHELVDDQVDARTAARQEKQQIIEMRIVEAARQGSFGIDDIFAVANDTDSTRSDIEYSISRLQQAGKLVFDGHGYIVPDSPE